MPEPDPHAGRTYIWTISWFLFVCMAAGGGCLVAYVCKPGAPVLLVILGFTLVCLPWLFWLMTIVYRIVSRAYGFRMIISCLYSDGGAGGGAAAAPAAAAAAADDIDGAQVLDVNAKSPPSSPENYEGRRVQFGEAVVINDNHKHGDSTRKADSSSSSSSNDISRASHESEMPLASSMAS